MRKIPGILTLLFAIGLLFKALGFLGKAFTLIETTAPVAYRQQYISEYLWSFAFGMLLALGVGWWGVAQLRRRRAVQIAAKADKP